MKSPLTAIFASLYLILGICGWAALVLLAPATLIGSGIGFLAMLIFIPMGMFLLPPRWIRVVMTVLACIGGMCLFMGMSVLLFLAVYGKEFN